MTSTWGGLDTDLQLLQGDCHPVLGRLVRAGAADFDSIVTDPPYGVGEYDWGLPPVEVWAMLRNALKPGGFMLATGNPRTFHRQMVMMEDAGWVIRDMLMWLFGHAFSQKRGSAQWAVQQELMGNRAAIQRGVLQAPARKWRDYGSKLKPAWEPIILAQNPGSGDMGKDLVRHGVGAINVARDPSPGQQTLFTGFGDWGHPPNNLLLDHQALDEVTALFGRDKARFFYCRHPSARERHAGCEDLATQNDHPTLKPVALMRWMIRLVTPYGGTVLDPFCGSGSTGIAAAQEDCKFVGIDLDPHYLLIARRRIQEFAERKRNQEQRAVRKLLKPPNKIKLLKRRTEARALDGEAKCRKGHSLTEQTIYKRPDGRTECKICKQLNRKQKSGVG